MTIYHSEEINSSNESPNKSLDLSLMKEYERLGKKLKQMKKELNRIYKSRPCINCIPKVSPDGEFLLVFQFYRENLLTCLKAMNYLEEKRKKLKTG
ncbi:MAG: hypothetical protein M3142_01050 [Bacteroidota bacterium]|nr:hypothetical protein [Bacteroidota bacterium]